jgi:hypothetical protein
MPRIFLYGADGANPILLNVDGPGADGSFTLRSLQLPNSKPFTFPTPVSIPGKFTAAVAGGDFRFDAGDGSGFTFTASYQLAHAADPFEWFGVQFQANGDLSAELVINIPVTGAAPDSTRPFAAVRVCGEFEIAGAPGSFTSNPFCCQVEMPDLPALPSSAPAPGFRLRLPGIGLDFPRLSLPWNFPNFPTPPFHLPGFSLPSIGPLPISVSYDSIDAAIAAGSIVIDIHHLRIGGKVNAIEADLHIVFTAGKIDPASSAIHLYQPDFSHTTDLPISSWNVGSGCLTLGWNEPKLRDLLSLVLPDFSGLSLPASGVKLRVLSDGKKITEVRLDWAMPSQTLPLPGFEVTTPNGTFAIVGDLTDSRLLLVLQVASGGSVTASSTFTWARADQRELLRDDQQNPATKFLTFGATALTPAAAVLLDLPLNGGDPPKFLRQLKTPLIALGTDCTAVVYDPESMQIASWGSVQLQINTGASGFQLPFLRSGGNQFLTVTIPTQPTLTLGNDPQVVIPLDVKVQVLDLSFDTTIKLGFHLESFAFSIDDSQGIAFVLNKNADGDLFGLHWSFRNSTGANSGFEVFRLVTSSSAYQLKQGADCVFELEYTAATAKGSPIVFSIRNFAVGPKGIDLDASVAPRPARLSGIDTEFTFTQGSFQIHQNQLTDFSIAGSGPLPPALVGSATADIALQFHKPEGSGLKLVSGAAKLSGKNLLKCQGTRFQFSVDALGLKFVDDGGYHLYFTVTGTAKFVPLAGDDPSGPLAWLPAIELRLMECPLTGDARVIAKHVQFLIEMPRKMTFSILGCFAMEVRAIGFVPQATMFDEFASAMRLSGQIKFAEGGGDVLDARIDFHDLFVGLPAPGSLIPRIYCKELGLKLKVGEAFEANGIVDFLDNEEVLPGVVANGFRGQGELTIQGLPTLAVSFAFLRVSNDSGVTWARAWFVYAEVDKLSLEIPIVELFIREIGFGFGYRYTLAMIQAADQIQDPKQLIKTLTDLSRSQGDLASFDQWRVDYSGLNSPGDPRWTIVFRALIAESSATRVPTEWIDAAERELPCLFILDAVVALRSDLTFLMTARGWLFTNYWEYVNDTNGVRRAPLVSGFVLLSPRQKRFLAHLASNPNAQFGNITPLPGFLLDAVRNSHFSATILVQPGLIHYELGWPNQLGWKASLGPLTAEFSGGTIFRVSTTEIVNGFSYQARGSLDLEAGVDFGFIGARLTAHASVAYGSRYIGVIALEDTVNRSAFYAVEGIDIRVAVSIEFWIKIDVLFGSITLNFHFSFDIAITASVQVGLLLHSNFAGIRGSATVALNIMGHGLHFGISIGVFPDVVDTARSITQQFLNIGLEATDVQPIPGEPPTLGDAAAAAAPGAHALVAAPLVAAPVVVPAAAAAGGLKSVAKIWPGALGEVVPGTPPRITPLTPVAAFITPNYIVFSVPPKAGQTDHFFALIPSATPRAAGDTRLGFVPPPPNDALTPTADFQWTLPGAVANLKHFDHASNTFADVSASATLSWTAAWDDAIGTLNTSPVQSITLRQTLRYAYTLAGPADFGKIVPIDDPIWPGSDTVLRDDRLDNPADSAYEAAVRGASEQVTSPRFKADPYSPFDQGVSQAYSFNTTIYQTDAQDQGAEDSVPQAVHLRSATIHQIIRDVADYAANPASVDIHKSLAFRLGLVFSVPEANAPGWLLNGGDAGTMSQRTTTASSVPNSASPGTVAVFNTAADRFDKRPPRFDRVRQFADDNSIGIAWDLAWDGAKPGIAHDDPEHHLSHYLIRRRPLDGSERGLEYTVRPADVLHRPDGAANLTRIRTRFHILDHFNNESAEEQAALPIGGKTYLYTVTPIDVSGFASTRPLSLVSTRLPQRPPIAPTDAELTVSYTLGATLPDVVTQPLMQAVDDPIAVRWTPPVAPPGTPKVPAVAYRLLFRREQVLPIGAYGLGSSAKGSQVNGLPVSNARPLRTDIQIALTGATNPDPTDPREYQVAKLADLKTAGIVAADGAWRADSWLVFLQARSKSGVWSSLVPVQLRLSFQNAGAATPVVRQPASLEFIAQPLAFKPLPPEDERARTGFADVPMPADAHLKVAADPIAQVSYAPHPEHPRAIEFRWNQAPADATVPPDLQAGFGVYEFDTDAHTPAELTDANLRLVQQIELLSPDEVALVPPDTLQTQRWEGWYAALIERASIARASGLKTTYSDWFSWRDSMVVWPPLHDMFKQARLPKMHPFLSALVDALAKQVPAATIDISPIPAAQPKDLAGFLNETSPAVDPYGWRILQRLGLAICFTLRDRKTGVTIAGADALAQVRTAIGTQLPLFADLAPHLHVELLFQPGESVKLDAVAATGDALLDALQVSLRPAAKQIFSYATVDITSTQTQETVTVTLAAGKAITAIEFTSGAAAGQWTIATDQQKLLLAIPSSGKVTLLFRAEALAAAPIAVSATAKVSALQPFDVSDQRSAYFTATAADWAARADAQAQFTILGSYLKMAGAVLPSPITDDLISWMARFLDQSPRKPAEGPWIATAYQRLVSPLPVAPNDAGQITYLHLVTDAYAHALRYYIRPRGRYDDLWQAVASSPLYRGAISLSIGLDPTAGGLDVVLDRVAEVARPLILSSRRIDALATIAQPSPPGAIWEVIVAKHPEQTLVERNWTLARQLAWGQLACTLMRTFAFQTPLVSLRKALVPAQYDFNIEYVENLPGASLLPSAYPPPETERLDFSNPADLRAVDLPQRIATFSQGALVLQYRAMPYFYKQRFVVAAQAGRVASQPAAVVQRDFEYRSPAPHIIVDAIDLQAVRFRLFRVQLATYWECSPDATQAQWSIEAPFEHDAPPVGTKPLRKYSSLPETAVAYQLVLNRSAGVSEAIVEFYFDPSVPAYAKRQFSPTLSVTLRGLEVPDMLTDRQAPVFLEALIAAAEVTRIAHLRAQLAAIPDFGALASKPGADALDGVVAGFLARWFPLRALSTLPLFPATTDWQAAIETRPADQWVLAWDGTKAAALDAWSASVDPVLAARIQSLKTAPIITIPPFLAPSDIPVSLRHSLTVAPSQVTWTGATTDATLAQFDTLLGTLADKSPAKTALAAIRAKLNTDLPQPPGAATFDGPLPDKATLAALLSNPLTHLDISGLAGAWQIFDAGINLGEPAENLLDRLATAIPDSNDNVRKALTAVFTAVAKFTVAAAIPGVPAALADNVLLGVYVLHFKGPIPSLAVFQAAFATKPDQASMTRLLADVAQEQAFSGQLSAWTSEEAVSSRSVFAQSATWQNRVEFPVPEACQLHIDGSLSPGEISQLLAVRADSSFNDAMRQLASGQPDARATLGLEQLLEIAPNAGVPTAVNRNVTWRGPLRPNQDAALLRWIQVSAFAGTFSDLRAKLTGFTFHADFDPSGEYPRQNELAPALAGRLTIGRGTLDWTSLLLDADQESALKSLAADASFSGSFHTAINGLVDAAVHSASVAVPVREADWAPRPKPGDLLPKKLLIGNARIQWFGLMSRADALGLQSGQSDPDKDAIARLFADASSAGLAGAEFAAWARLGSAAVETSPLDTTL